MSGKISKIVYEKRELRSILRQNYLRTRFPRSPGDFLGKFLGKVESQDYLGAANMFFDLRILQFKKIVEELHKEKPDFEQVCATVQTISGTMLVDKMVHLLAKEWLAESNRNFENMKKYYDERNKQGLISAVKWHIRHLLQEKKEVAKKSFVIRIIE